MLSANRDQNKLLCCKETHDRDLQAPLRSNSGSWSTASQDWLRSHSHRSWSVPPLYLDGSRMWLAALNEAYETLSGRPRTLDIDWICRSHGVISKQN